MLPNFLIIGAMRSGTTSLARWLRPHPEVFMPVRKELHYFDVHFDRGMEWYDSQFADYRGEPAVGEATPRYLYCREALPRIKAALPSVLLIVILRNPVDRAYSHYWLNRGKGKESLDFVDALEAEPARLAAATYGAADRHSYLDRGRYLAQLEHVCANFDRSGLCAVLFDDLVADPAGTYETVCRFLGVRVDTVPEVVGKAANGAATYRSLGLRRLVSPLPRNVRITVSRFNRRQTAYPPMEERLRRRLVAQFEQENLQLGKWLDRDLSAWNR